MNDVYEKYLNEVYGYKIIRDETGFLSWGIIDFDGKNVVYVQDFFIEKQFRNAFYARKLFSKVESICAEKEIDTILASVGFKINDMERILMLYIIEGFKIHSQRSDITYLTKRVFK